MKKCCSSVKSAWNFRLDIKSITIVIKIRIKLFHKLFQNICWNIFVHRNCVIDNLRMGWSAKSTSFRPLFSWSKKIKKFQNDRNCENVKIKLIIKLNYIFGRRLRFTQDPVWWQGEIPGLEHGLGICWHCFDLKMSVKNILEVCLLRCTNLYKIIEVLAGPAH